ncbi:hypothetical protein [Kitasatospora kifunensis]|uniref:Uncharacterized protein n=1 Tax=Kitasatospora kifunensis TaxID=58351 RepID=A0A7W7VTA6_KITKI|nr:hypothetical protein [Kitasatospora kifunensis]MBB4921568.1 hypothetical protein [Kitasatospora kifunensis]
MTPCQKPDAVPSSAPSAVVVEIVGITPPTRFARLSDALPALWHSMSRLPLGEQQADWFGYYLTRPDAVERVREKLERSSSVELSFQLSDGPHLMRVQLAAAEAQAP